MNWKNLIIAPLFLKRNELSQYNNDSRINYCPIYPSLHFIEQKQNYSMKRMNHVNSQTMPFSKVKKSVYFPNKTTEHQSFIQFQCMHIIFDI